ncbi:chitin synthase export chaperone [Paraphysoderma sedebokerense]|nr:chitin synthase export chaperone [Paraphysoderma sedebokerense]
MSNTAPLAFGSFRDICKTSASLPVCNLFRNREDKACSLVGLDLGAVRVLDFLDVIACILCLAGLVAIAYKTHSKYAAVGRKEMNLLWFSYFLLIISQIVSVGGWTLPNESFDTARVWASAVHSGLLVAVFWILLMNGFVGYQWVEDGTPLSLYSIFFSATFFLCGTIYIAADTGLGYSTAFQHGPELTNVALFVLLFLFPILSAVVYLILQIVLVTKNLSEKRPLWAAFLLFAISQVFIFVLNDSICEGTKKWIDGKIFSTLLQFAALFCVFKYWASITEDEWEDFEDQF